MKEHTYPLKMDHIAAGVCYYPEHWGETYWKKDLQLMKELGWKLPEWESLPGISLSPGRVFMILLSLTVSWMRQRKQESRLFSVPPLVRLRLGFPDVTRKR